VLNWPLGDPSLCVGAAVMVNVLGSGDMDTTMGECRGTLSVPGATMHWYGKGEARAGRKMAHVTVVGRDAATLRASVVPFMGEENAAVIVCDVASESCQ
jgi:phosphoribosylaminoimidazole carboxylase